MELYGGERGWLNEPHRVRPRRGVEVRKVMTKPVIGSVRKRGKGGVGGWEAYQGLGKSERKFRIEGGVFKH